MGVDVKDREFALQTIIDLNQKCIEQLRAMHEHLDRLPSWALLEIERHRLAIASCQRQIEDMKEVKYEQDSQ